MKFKDSQAVRRLLEVNCPIVAFWFPWYWRKTDTARLRKVAGRWLWRSESGFLRKATLLVKTIAWPLVALAQLTISWSIYNKDINREIGCGRMQQLKDMVWLVFWRGFPPGEYYGQRMYLDKLSDIIDDFLSSHEVSLLNLAASAGKDTEVVNNKGRFEIAAREMGLPVIPTVSLYKNGAISGSNMDKPLPEADLYLKPVDGLQGRGIERWNFNPTEGNWSNGKEVKSENELKSHFLESSIEMTYVLQEAAYNHPNLESLSTGGLITFRIMTVCGVGGTPKTMGSYIVIPTGISPANHGVYGGMNAQMDLATGILDAAFQRLPVFRRHSNQPETGGRIEGFQVPGWPELEALALTAHKAFPDILTIGWDLAYTRKGPEIVEGNTQWGAMPGFYPGKTGYVSLYMDALNKARANGDEFGRLLR